MKHQSVLIVEDDKDTAVLFKTVLSLVGFECDIVLTAREALAWLAATVPDLILLDIRLGLEIGGGDILYQVRNNPRFDHTRVVVITGFPRLAEPITDLADLILLKPVEVDQLRELVTRVVEEEQAPKLVPYQDPVTELYKEDFFYSRLQLAFARSKRRNNFRFGILMVEAKLVGRFEQDIDSQVILELLREVSARLKANLRPMDTIARMAGWRFCVLSEELSELNNIEIIIKRVIWALSKPYLIGDQVFKIEVSIGAAVNQADILTPEDLIATAQDALKKALSMEREGAYIIAAANVLEQN